jgi:hypothetical protein
VGIDDALIVFGVLIIIFSGDSIAGRHSISRQRLVAVLHLAGTAFDSYIRAIALVIRGKPVLRPATV